MSHIAVSSLTILESASRGDTTTRDFQTPHYKGAEFILNQTAQASTVSFANAVIQGRIAGTTSYYTIGTMTPATAATFSKRLRIYPGASTALDSTGLQPSAAPYTINEHLPAIWRVKSTNASTSAATFSLTANLLA